MGSIVGAALRGFGRALKNKKRSGTIKSIKPAKNLSTKRDIQDRVVKAIDKGTKEGLKGATPSPHLKQSISKSKNVESKNLKGISYTYDDIEALHKKQNKNLKRKIIGAGATAVGGITGAHVAAKKKYPEYKKWMERDIKIKDGKVKLVPKKKK